MGGGKQGGKEREEGWKEGTNEGQVEEGVVEEESDTIEIYILYNYIRTEYHITGLPVPQLQRVPNVKCVNIQCVNIPSSLQFKGQVRK